MHEQIEKRLEEIERRLTALEGKPFRRTETAREPIPAAPPLLNFETTPPHSPLPPPLPATHSAPTPQTPAPLPTPSPARSDAPPLTTPTSTWVEEIDAYSQDPYTQREPGPRREKLKAFEDAAPIDWAKLESLIAGRWYALVGGLVVTIGVALFVQFAVKQGWLAQLPGWARCGMGAALGIVLLGLGEAARRKLNDWAAVGLTVAGLGSLYVSSYAAYALYKLMSPGTTLLILAGVAGVGIVISAATSLSVVGIAALIGAYIAPFIASSGNSGYVYLPPYWITLLLVGQILAASKGGTFAFCRWLTTCATLALGAGWVFRFCHESPGVGLAMLGTTWVLVQGEAWWTAHRAQKRGIIEYSEADLGRLLQSPSFLTQFAGLRVRPLFSVSTSAWAVSLGVHIARETHIVPESSVSAVIGTAALILAYYMVGPFGILNARPKTSIEKFAAALCVTAGALLVATIAIALSGFAQVITLTAVGLAALGAGRLLRTRVLDVYGGIVLLYAAGRVVLYDSWATAPNSPGFEMLGYYLTDWAAACAGIGAAWIAYAWTIIRSLPTPTAEPAEGLETGQANAGDDLISPYAWNVVSNLGIGLGVTLLGISLFHQKATHEAIAIACIATTAFMVLAAMLRSSTILRAASVVYLIGASAVTVALSWWSDRSHIVQISGLVLSAQMLVPLANAALALCLAWLYSPLSRDWEIGAKFISGLAVALVVAGVTHDQSTAGAMCCVWLGICLATSISARFLRGLGLAAHGIGVWVLVLGTWGAGFAIANWAGSKSPPLLHPGLWIAFALAASVLGLRKLAEGSFAENEAKAKAAAWWAAATIIWIATSLEVARLSEMLAIDTTARGAAVSIWWGIFAILLLVVGFWRNVPAVRRFGLGLLAVATGKALVIDLANVAPGWRAVSVVCLGLLMVAVGVVYARIAKLMGEAPSDSTKPSAAETTGDPRVN